MAKSCCLTIHSSPTRFASRLSSGFDVRFWPIADIREGSGAASNANGCFRPKADIVDFLTFSSVDWQQEFK